MSRSKRFDGISIEKNAIYIDPISGKESLVTDQDMAKFFATHYMDHHPSRIKNARLITHFSPTYDFRNKRLPIWRIDLDTPKEALFIDPATGMLVDQHISSDRLERYSFHFYINGIFFGHLSIELFVTSLWLAFCYWQLCPPLLGSLCLNDK